MPADDTPVAALWPDFYQPWLAGWTPIRPVNDTEENADEQ